MVSGTVLVVAMLVTGLVRGAGPVGAQDEGTGEETTETTEVVTTEAPGTTTPTPTTGAPATQPTTAPAGGGADPTDQTEPSEPAESVPATEASSGDDFDINWGAVVGIALAVALVVVVLAVALAAAQRRARDTRAFNRRLAQLVGRAQWIHDEGSLEVLGAASSPARLQVVWDDTLRRTQDVSAQSSALAATCSDSTTRDELRALTSTLGRLTGALDTHVSLHLQLSGDPNLQSALEGASETVMQRRDDLNRSISPLAARL